jgi:hypothetical protein
MKIRTEHPYYLGAVAAWLLFGCGGWMISGNANSGMVMGLLAGGAVFFYGLIKARDYSDDIEKPSPRVFAISEFEAFATVKDALTNNIDDKWWVMKNVDDTPDEDGYMKMKYACNFEEPDPRPGSPPMKRQIVIDALVTKVSDQASVELHFSVFSTLNRITADEVIEKTTTIIWTKLARLSAKRAAGPVPKANASYEF